MDAAGTVASWLSFMVTASGLGSLITQANAIEERLDPYRHSRSAEHLGSWQSRQPKSPWYQLRKPIPVGPVLFAKLVDGFCGFHTLGVSRLPLEIPGTASWTAVLANLHEQVPDIRRKSNTTIDRSNTIITVRVEDNRIHVIDIDANTPLSQKQYARGAQSWLSLATRPLIRLGTRTGVLISRTTFITLLVICNSEAKHHYNSANGYRAGYGCYCGDWYIEWPLGGIATVHFASHDSHQLSTNVYPPTFPVRVDRCIRMMLGIITFSDPEPF